MDRLTSMAVFTKVVEANSFSAAARTLGISQATASKHIQMLETWFGARLLNRTTRRVSMTEIGESFYAQCSRILDDMDDARRTGNNESSIRGALRIVAPAILGNALLGPVIVGYVGENPALTVDVVLTDRPVDPLEDGFDLAIRLGNDGSAGLVVRQITTLPLVTCASPSYVELNGRPATPEALGQHVCLLDRQIFPDGWRLNGAGSVGLSRLSYGLAANSALLLRDAAVAGAGVLLAPEFVVHGELALGRLVRLLPDWNPPPLELSVAIPTSRQLSAKVKGFSAYLAERLASQ